MKNYNKHMEIQADRERKFTQTMEKWIMYFMSAMFGGIFLLISFTGSFREGLIIFPIALISIPLTKWGIRWQNERYIRSAKNQDDLKVVIKRLDQIEKRISKLEEK